MDGDSKPNGRSLQMGGEDDSEEGGESSADPAFLSSARTWQIRAALGAHSVVKTREWLPTADPSGRFWSLRRTLVTDWMDLSEASEERLPWINGLLSVHYFYSF